MRIGLVTDFYYPWIGGPSTVVRNLGHGLAVRGHSVCLLAPSPAGAAGIEIDGPMAVTRVRTVPVPFGYNMRTAAWPRREAAAWLRDAAPDVIHVHHPFPLSATVVYEARSRQIPVLATNHTIPECSLWGLHSLGPAYRGARTALGWWIVTLLRRCSAVATPTDTAARALRTLGFTGPVTTVSNGVDTVRFIPGERGSGLRGRLGLDARPIVLYTGRLDAEKQMDVWLQAAAAATRQVNAQFVVGGQGADRPRLERIARQLGIADRVTFIGYISDEEFPEVYRLADIYLVTSPVELQSIATLEAVASGLPVVAVRAGALPELVHDGLNGFLIPAGDWRAAAGALVRVLTGGELRRRMGEESRRLALGHDLQRSVDAYERLLRSTAEGRGSARQ